MVSSPAGELGLDLDGYAGISWEVSNATNLSDLEGPFIYVSLSGDLGVGAFVTVFFSKTFSGGLPEVYGAQFGVSGGGGGGIKIGVENSHVLHIPGWVAHWSGINAFWYASDPYIWVGVFLSQGLNLLEDALKAYGGQNAYAVELATATKC